MPLIRVRRAAVVPADVLVPLLAPHERARLDRAAPADRAAVASVLLLARRAVAEACGVEPDAVRVRRRCPRCGSAAHGVPVADRTDGGQVPHVSLSRGGDLVVVALSDDGPVGVDVEPVRRTEGDPRDGAGVRARGGDDLARVVLAPGEPPAAGPHGLLRTWARTEAVLKAAGTGLAVDPRALRVSDAAGRPEVRVVDPAAGAALARAPGTRWWLTDIDAGADHIAALAALLPMSPSAPPALDDRTFPLP
ncbi:4'-phosphopantetheinyl transferase superfamily protein [Cellulomonas sp. PS-H5]|uniref:4'-phosphopantetheinyl transferase family protein n=1 Tax=Cellulomonas sp. PS-H5 TaxID=2820400 RepID=UPI001C501476|nr:4'-phosphopantetheinyl transferase superfamily protein [Cellulomonas sp. PS-H5]MBW0253919.1 4'-phosphopantetheinyl transferase superfamily protein [Cellulomonas sp. PS-H5]